MAILSVAILVPWLNWCTGIVVHCQMDRNPGLSSSNFLWISVYDSMHSALHFVTLFCFFSAFFQIFFMYVFW